MKNSYAYAFSAHSELILSEAANTRSQLYALIDAGQLPDSGSLLRRHLAGKASDDLFAHTFADAALAASPLLVQIGQNENTPSRQIGLIDDGCLKKPIISYLQTKLSLAALSQHLKTLLRIQTADADFLLRYTDPLLLEPIIQMLTPSQRASFLMDVEHWWVTDHRGRLQDVCQQSITASPAPLPLTFDAQQIDALLEACAPCFMMAQLRNLDRDFSMQLNPAEQADFVFKALEDASAQGIEGDSERAEWCLSRWLEKTSTATRKEKTSA